MNLPADMNNKVSFIVLFFFISTLAFATVASSDYHSDKMLLSDLKVITLHQGRMTNARRSSPVPQLKCIGGSAQHKFQPRTVQCTNKGSDGYDIQWECKTDMDNAYRFGHVGVNCEGYDYPNDPFILKGSCGLEYTIEYTEEGKQREKHKGGSGSGSFGHGSKSYAGRSLIGLGVFLGVLFVIYIIYKVCLTPHASLGYQPTYTGPSPSSQPPPYGFRPEFTDAPPPYDNYNPNYGGNRQHSSNQNNDDGFLVGAAIGTGLGYLFGSDNSHRHDDWSSHRRNSYDNSGFDSSPPPSPRSSGTRTASGFGGTTRR